MIKLVMTKKQQTILIAIILAFALGVLMLYTNFLRDLLPKQPDEIPAQVRMLNTIESKIRQHNEIYKNQLRVLTTETYNIDNPLVIVNPYDSSPLTAVIIFNTAVPSEVSVYITGKTEQVSISHTFEGYETEHLIPVYGLYPGVINMVKISAQPDPAADPTAAIAEKWLMIETEDIPQRFEYDTIFKYTEGAAGTKGADEAIDDHAQPAFFFTHITQSAFDINGDCRWVYTGYRVDYPTKYHENEEKISFIEGYIENNTAILIEADMLGRVLTAVPYSAELGFSGSDENQPIRREFYLQG